MALPPEAWTREGASKRSAVMGGREGNQAQFKPGVDGIILIFSDQVGQSSMHVVPYELWLPTIISYCFMVTDQRGMAC